jgi:putative NIF3 family GTP cyclohydrolase 1 type 2
MGPLPAATTLGEFAVSVKERLGLQGLRYVGDAARRVRKVAVCGGSGVSLMRNAHYQGADVLVTGDVKYHEAREAEDLGLGLVDAGHFATERVMIEGFAGRLRKELAGCGLQAEVAPFAGEREPFAYL